jgi:spermidine synthase
LGLSTIGSFLGAVGTTIILMHYFGVAFTVFFVFATLILLALLLSETRHKLLLVLPGVLAASIFIYAINIGVEKHLFLQTTNFANYQVINSKNSPTPLRDDQKMLVINEVYSSYTDETQGAFPYIEAMRKVIFDDLQLRNADILVLGAGGFSLSEADVSGNHYTYVDIDDQIKKVVVPAYRDQIKDKLVIDDARHYVHASQKDYDVIVIDVYSDTKSIPAHLLTREFLLDIKKHLRQPGYAVFNIIANPAFKDAYSKRIDNTIRSVFGSCAVIPTRYYNGTSNLIYACNNLTQSDDNVVYTDNLNNSATDSFAW